MLEIAPADWSALLEHADAIDSFDRPEPEPAGPSDRIFHLAITAGNRSRELAINGPFETSELAHLITLTRRAMRDRQVLSPNMLDGVQFAASAAAWVGAQSAQSRRRSEPLTSRTNAGPMIAATGRCRAALRRPVDILDVLDMADVGEIDIVFERPHSHPRPATFD